MVSDVDRDALTVRLERIGTEGYDLETPIAREWLEEIFDKDSPYTPVADGALQVHLERVMDVIHVRGRMRLALGAHCSRCLEPADLALDTPIQVSLFPLGQEPAAKPDGELDSDDTGVATYEGQLIELGDLLRDEVFLELPMNPVCRTDCAGLCARCGADLNHGVCDCPPTGKQRLSAFANLKLDPQKNVN
ncbi:MAG: DUF177 domain-containing protein [Myxococcota bacterium]